MKDTKFPQPRQATIEHVRRVKDGGSTDWDNCVLACRSCNMIAGELLERENTRLGMFFRPLSKDAQIMAKHIRELLRQCALQSTAP